jgi:Putative transposase DNA-binding domain
MNLVYLLSPPYHIVCVASAMRTAFRRLRRVQAATTLQSQLVWVESDPGGSMGTLQQAVLWVWLDADLTLADRTFRCEQCGLVRERDLNAAINLEKLAGSFL